MTPQQKADKIFNRFYDITCNTLDAKECSFFFIEEMMDNCSTQTKPWWKEVKDLIKAK